MKTITMTINSVAEGEEIVHALLRRVVTVTDQLVCREDVLTPDLVDRVSDMIALLQKVHTTANELLWEKEIKG